MSLVVLIKILTNYTDRKTTSNLKHFLTPNLNSFIKLVIHSLIVIYFAGNYVLVGDNIKFHGYLTKICLFFGPF